MSKGQFGRDVGQWVASRLARQGWASWQTSVHLNDVILQETNICGYTTKCLWNASIRIRFDDKNDSDRCNNFFLEDKMNNGTESSTDDVS